MSYCLPQNTFKSLFDLKFLTSPCCSLSLTGHRAASWYRKVQPFARFSILCCNADTRLRTQGSLVIYEEGLRVVRSSPASSSVSWDFLRPVSLMPQFNPESRHQHSVYRWGICASEELSGLLSIITTELWGDHGWKEREKGGHSRDVLGRSHAFEPRSAHRPSAQNMKTHVHQHYDTILFIWRSLFWPIFSVSMGLRTILWLFIK